VGLHRVKRGDEVIVVAGKDKGKRGQVSAIYAERVLVEGLNLVKKHQRANPARGIEGGIVRMEKPLHASNIMLWNEQMGKGDRVGVRILEDGRRVRYFKSNGELVDPT